MVTKRKVGERMLVVSGYEHNCSTSGFGMARRLRTLVDPVSAKEHGEMDDFIIVIVGKMFSQHASMSRATRSV